jgi:molybdopterin/thiamine biosynthesis adenylyltransferase/nitroreductase
MLQSIHNTQEYAAILLDRKLDHDNAIYNQLIEQFGKAIELDQFASQKKELIKICHPQIRLTSEQVDTLYNEFIQDKDASFEGIWVYYPWLNKLIHTLQKEEFIQLRTSRNQHRITAAEQTYLSQKTIGIIGLSIGHSVALTLAGERTCGKLKLADFDTLELSNLNRIRTGIQNIGLNKCVITARQIAEIDPFLEVECFTEGITNHNLVTFLTEGGKLDLLIDECDGLEIKIACRQEAKKHNIPVLMETSDRGMLDVERYDLEPERPLFHGLLNGIPEEKLTHIEPQDRIPLVMRIVDVQNGSKRGKLSMLEIGQSISTWPQLASAATLGGAVVTDTSRRILLDQFKGSGRFYVDLEQIISKDSNEPVAAVQNPFHAFEYEKAVSVAKNYCPSNSFINIDESKVKYIIEKACLAPSIRNSQPWKWVYNQNCIYLFHDRSRSFAFDNFDNISAYNAFGAAFENLTLASAKMGLGIKTHFLAEKNNPELVAIFELFELSQASGLTPVYAPERVELIRSRSTNRKIAPPVAIPLDHVKQLKNTAESVENLRFHYLSDRSGIDKAAEILGKSDLITLLHQQGHHDFFQNTIQWNKDTSEGDGVLLQDMEWAGAQLAAFSILKDTKVANTLREIEGGQALAHATTMGIRAASGIGLITVPDKSKESYFKAGIALQRLWLQAEELGYNIHPMSSLINLFLRLDTADSLSDSEILKAKELKCEFDKVFPETHLEVPMFIFKISPSDRTSQKTKHRLPLTNTLMILNSTQQ